MALNFPANPEDGDIYENYTYSEEIGAWIFDSSPYATELYVDGRINTRIPLTQKGEEFGVAELDGDATVEMSQLNNIIDSAPNDLNTIGKLAKRFNTKTKTEWESSTEILPHGSINSEMDTSTGTVRHKIGNGSDIWNDLPYVLNNSDIDQILEELDLKASVAGDTFNGTLIANSDFIVNGEAYIQNVSTIVGVTGEEIFHLSGVTSPIQEQLDEKIDSVTIEGLAPKNSPTFSGTVVLPQTTSIGGVSQDEISTLNGISTFESIQDQFDAMQVTLDGRAPVNSPVFTGTVYGITKSMVGLANVDNTSDLNKPISIDQQNALDLKANVSDVVQKASLSGATFTGPVILPGDPTQALQATTKSYVDNVASGILAKPSVVAATTSNLDGTYDNGTSGAGATLTATSNGAFPLIDGVSVTTINGQRGILLKNQTNSFENGRYNLTTQGDENTAWVLTRCGLCDEASEIPGAYIFVTDGDLNSGTGWVLYVDDPATFTVGTDSISAFQFAGTGAVTAGSNIEVTGNEVAVVDSPSFVDVIDVSSAGVQFSDGVQTKAGVPSATSFVYKTASYTLDSLSLADSVIEVDSTEATTITIPLDSALDYPIGTSLDILQTNTGTVTIDATGGVTLNGTPGFKLRTRWSSATILKRASNSWIVYGDLTV
jgi:hypothetical protein